MTDQKQKKLNRELAKNVVSFEWCKDGINDLQSLCSITIGGIAAVERYSLDGLEKKVLQEMMVKYYSIKESIGVN